MKLADLQGFEALSHMLFHSFLLNELSGVRVKSEVICAIRILSQSAHLRTM